MYGGLWYNSIEEHDLLIVHLYGPNEDDPKFFMQIIRQIANIASTEVILMGDFSLVLDPKVDRSDHKTYKPKSYQVLILLMKPNCKMHGD